MMAAALATRAKTLGQLVGAAAGPYAGLAVTDLVLDSRQVRPGAAFVAVPGGRDHGLAHAGEALARGAVAVLYEPASGFEPPQAPSVAVPGLKAGLGALAQRFFDDAVQPEITGVTGTNGKTTVAWLLSQALGRPARRCGYIGTLGFGVPPKLERHGHTTPDCLTLHREIATMDVPRVAMEVSSHALSQDRIAGLSIATAVFTNLTRDHLDEHGDLASYGRAKERLFRLPGLAHAVVNADDPFAATLAGGLPPGCALVRTSTRGRPGVELAATVGSLGLAGLTLSVDGRFGRATLRSPLIGDFNAENLLVALGALVAQGMPLAVAAEALAGATAAPGRMEVQGGGPGAPWVVVDYAHTPDALARVLTTLRAAGIGSGSLWCVFGCGGDRDRGKRPLMGTAAAGFADRIVLTDDNPRGEDPAAIVAEIRAGIGAHPAVTVEHDRRRAILETIARAAPGDVVLVAGKGHETVQIVGNEQRPFADRAVVAAALAPAGSPTPLPGGRA